MFILVKWVFWNYLNFGHIGPISALWGPQNFHHWWFPAMICYTHNSIFFMRGLYVVHILVKRVFSNDFIFGHIGQIFILWGLKMTPVSGSRPLSWIIFTQSTSYIAYTSATWVVRCFDLGPNFGPIMAKKWPLLAVSEQYIKHWSLNPLLTWCIHWF